MLEAEQIRKKYKTIEKSLMNDGKYYESNLREIDKALSKQQIDIDNLKVSIHPFIYPFSYPSDKLHETFEFYLNGKYFTVF